MHDTAPWFLLFAVTIIAVASACRRFGVSAPLALTALGIVVSFVPGLPEARLEPDLILVGVLPPLLYAAAIQVSILDIKREIRAILVLSVGLVLVTTVLVGLVGWWLLPVPLAAAFALGAVVAPPDAVAATAVARRIGLPRRLVTVLEGESLVNDATAIVLLHTTTAAIVGTVSPARMGLDFALSVVGGLAVGTGVAFALRPVRRRIDDAITSTAITLVVPWVSYLAAESVHGSGVLAVVVTGLLLAYRSPIDDSASARLTTRTNWATIQFILENSVFLLAGLQLAGIVEAVAGSPLGWTHILLACAAIIVTAVVTRPVWIAATAWWLNVPDANGQRMTRGELGVASWAGMRGVVTLAAVLTLPERTPYREVLVLAAMLAVAGTLLVQGLTLPALARRLQVRGPDPRADALQAATLLQTASQAGLRELDRIEADPETHATPETLDDLRSRALRRPNAAWEELGAPGGDETPSQEYRRLRLCMLHAERAEVLGLRTSSGTDQEVVQAVLSSLDVEESMLVAITRRAEHLGHEPLVTPAAVAGDCEHLRTAATHPDPDPRTTTCPDCIAEGLTPVHLRLCLTCGYVGCCDSSPGQHTTRHVNTACHPVVRSFEPGERWRWCYVDEQLG